MNVILLVATTILAVASSEPIGERRTRDVKDIVDGLADRNNSSHQLNENATEDYDETNESNGLDAVPGVPGKDYPNFNFIPKTSFTCSDKKPGGYYADIETRCQVFHVCNVGDVKSSFLCPPGSIFNQKYLVCDWWYDFECEHASDLFSYKDTVNRGSIQTNFEGTGEFYTNDENPQSDTSFAYKENNSVNDMTDLSLAGTGEGSLGYSRNKSNRQFGKSDHVNSGENKKFPSQIERNNVNLTKQFTKNDNFNHFQQTQLRNYQNDNENSNYQNRKYQNENRNYENENRNYQNGNYQNENGNYQNENGKYQNENGKYQNENYQNGNRNLKNENRNYQNENKNYQSENKNYQNENRNYQNENRNYQNDNGNYQNENRNYQNENRNYQNENKNHQNENRNYQNENRNYQNGNNKNYPNENKNYHNEDKNYQSENSRNDQKNNKNFQNENKNYKNENSNRQADFNENSDKFFDLIPRGFAVNYGQTSTLKNQIPPNNRGENSKSSLTTPSLNFHQQGNNFQTTEKTDNQENEDFNDDETTEENINDEDTFDRQRQLEVDNTILNKKIHNNFDNTRNEEFNYDYDSESRKLSSENPPLQDNANYYNYYEDKVNSHFSSDVNSKNDEHFNNQNKYNERGENSRRFNNGPNVRKLDNNLRPPNFSSFDETTVNSNFKGLSNKETAHHSGIIPNLEDNGFFSSVTQTSTGSRSFGKISEFTTGYDNSRLSDEKSHFQQSQNNENQQNSYNYNADNNYGTSFNYENANQSQTKEY